MDMTINKKGEKMKYIAIVSKDKKQFKMFEFNTITRVDVLRRNDNPDDDSRMISVCETGCHHHAMKIVEFDFDRFVSFINENEDLDNIFVITVEKI